VIGSHQLMPEMTEDIASSEFVLFRCSRRRACRNAPEHKK
jgi:hypothetical protein